MQFVSWNVNGLRACLTKGFGDFFQAAGADFFCLQETKLQAGQVELDLPGYSQYWSYAEKKGYSGTAVFAREPALAVTEGLGDPALDGEGRILTLEYPDFYLVNCYTPNAQEGLKRLSHRMAWDDAYRAHLQALDAKKPVIACADYNVAHQEIDVTGAYSWWSYRFNARKNNAGWRIDYFLVSDRLKDRIADTPIYRDVFGSDHCPIGLSIEV